MMKQVYQLRYRRFILWIGIIIVGIYLFSGFTTQHSWHAQKEYLYSADFYFTPEMGQQYDQQGNVTTTLNKQEYVKQALQFFSSSDETNMHYTTSISQNILLSIMPLLVVILGFLTFFLDQKSQFNRFLFSLSFSRKRLYIEKVVYILGPFLGFLALGIIGYNLLMYTMIPQPYFNASVMEIVHSGFSHFLTLTLAFCFGMFLGVSLGNTFSAILFFCLVNFTLANSLGSFYLNIMNLFTNRSSDLRVSIEQWLVFYPGKNGSTILSMGINVLMSLILVYLSYIVFNRLSMEDDGDFLTVPKFRHYYFIIGSLISIVYLICSGAMWELSEYMTIRDFVITGLFLLVVPVILAILIYFSSIKLKLEQRRQKKVTSS